jgi:predicted HTH domain antitoxin
MKSKILSTRVKEKIADEIKEVSKERGVDRSYLVKQLIIRGLKDLKIQEALKEYNLGKISLSKASEKAGLSVKDFLALIPENKVELNYNVWDLKDDLSLEL